MIKKKILIIGSLGYLGSKLFKHLSNEYEVTGIDNHFFANAILSDKNLNNKIFKKDVRDLDESFITNFDVVILLAGISNDPLDKKKEDFFYQPSLEYSIFVADICKKHKLKLIFPSSCSVYGFNKDTVSEESLTNPLTGYSRNKVEIENYLIKISNNHFNPIILRFATIYGMSPRMRFDLVINMLVGMAITKKRIILNSDGESWRPHLHIDDAIKSIIYSIDFNNFKDHMIVNVGQNQDNLKIIDIAKIISKKCKCPIEFLSDSKFSKIDFFNDRKIINNRDQRSYIVNFDKIKKIFKNFKFSWKLESGIDDLVEQLILSKLDEKLFLKREFYRLQQLEYMYNNNIINEKLEFK